MPLITYMQPIWSLAHRLSSTTAAERTQAFFDADRIVKAETTNWIVRRFLERRMMHEIDDQVLLLRTKTS